MYNFVTKSCVIRTYSPTTLKLKAIEPKGTEKETTHFFPIDKPDFPLS